uniref:Protein Vpu n=1 Tax=Steinernema glaseri TaxID=37863 RepID=A0A1I7YFX4_9BILA
MDTSTAAYIIWEIVTITGAVIAAYSLVALLLFAIYVSLQCSNPDEIHEDVPLILVYTTVDEDRHEMLIPNNLNLFNC